MDILTIVTSKHRTALEDSATSFFPLSCTPVESNLYGVEIPKSKVNTEALIYLLERIIIEGHPVYGNSPKLADMAQELQQTEIHKCNINDLTLYIKENDLLHLEGYASFRMTDYRNRLDILMYCLIKKLRLTDQVPL